MGRPLNVLLVVSDQERQRSWLPAGVSLPWRERLMAEGVELGNHWTHSSPCSPSRGTLFTGRYLPGHGVAENVIHPWHRELDPGIRTIGHRLRAAGYRSSYIGKWHLARGSQPDMEAYGFSDWSGDDRHFMGWAGTGVHFDPIIASNAAAWLRANGGDPEPWCLSVALVNPHDVMWFPMDQPGYQTAHAEEAAFVRQILEAARWKEDETLPTFTDDYPAVCSELPPNFDDDLHTKPETQRQWRYDQQHGFWGYIDPADTQSWLRHLDYYVELHRRADESLGVVLSALEAAGAWDDTAIIFTSDHGDMCGSHGLRSKGPFVYDEIMRVPLYARIPGVTTAGTVGAGLSSHVDLAPTICALAGAPADGLDGVDLTPLLADPVGASVRDHVLFAHDSAHTRRVQQTRYAVRGVFDGRFKYARYYGVGGGFPSDSLDSTPTRKLFDVDAPFDDNDHELYDLHEDPHELVNLAMDRSRRADVRAWFARLRELEATELDPTGS
jgi:arylsulfatase